MENCILDLLDGFPGKISKVLYILYITVLLHRFTGKMPDYTRYQIICFHAQTRFIHRDTSSPNPGNVVFNSDGPTDMN